MFLFFSPKNEKDKINLYYLVINNLFSLGDLVSFLTWSNDLTILNK